MKRVFLLAVLAGLVLALGMESPAAAQETDSNPAAEGFDFEGSDPEAIALADRVMQRLGGRQAWDRTRYLRWTFFGRRHHVWDKHTGDIRIEGVDRESESSFLILMNLHTLEGRAWEAGEKITDPARLAAILDRGEALWINDSYWLVMPYKLKDTGVTLEYLGAGSLEDGRPAEVLQLTFAGVGRTPDNKYRVWVAEESGLVEQWAYYPKYTDEEPAFTSPWRNWRQYGEIMLADNRGDREHTDLAVYDELPASVFTSPEPVDWSSFD